MTIDRLDPLLHLLDQTGNLAVLGQPRHQVRCFGIELIPTNDGFADAFQTPDIVENLFDQGAENRQQFIGLVDGKKSLVLSGIIHRQIFLAILFSL